MRTKKSIVNILVNCLCYLVFMVATFVVRQMFSRVLGLALVGIDGGFSNIVSILAVVELGLGIGMSYKLYEPIFKKDWLKISNFLNFLKKTYVVISSIILISAIIFSLFLVKLIGEDSGLTNLKLRIIFLLYTLDVISSYLFFHKRTMFIADQKSYINNLIKIPIIILTVSSQIFVLIFLKSFELYIITKITFRILENILISYFFKKHYPLIDLTNSKKLEPNERKEILKNIKAMLFHRIGGASIKQISGVIVLIFATLRENGIFYNYLLITGAVLGITSEIFNGISASFGNLLTTESEEKVYENFKVIFFLNFLIYSSFSAIFLNTVSPFMKIWIGTENSIFSPALTVAITVNLYLYGMKQSVDMVKSSAGIFLQDRFIPILETTLNFIVSFILAKKFGIIGAIIGGILSTILVPFISQPYFIYKIVFNKKLIEYYKKYILYTTLTIFYTIATYKLTGFIVAPSLILQISINFLICLTLPTLINIIVFRKDKQLIFLSSVAGKVVKDFANGLTRM